MVQANLETHYTKKLNCVTSNLLREKVVQIIVNYEESLK